MYRKDTHTCFLGKKDRVSVPGRLGASLRARRMTFASCYFIVVVTSMIYVQQYIITLLRAYASDLMRLTYYISIYCIDIESHFQSELRRNMFRRCR